LKPGALTREIQNLVPNPRISGNKLQNRNDGWSLTCRSRGGQYEIVHRLLTLHDVLVKMFINQPRLDMHADVNRESSDFPTHDRERQREIETLCNSRAREAPAEARIITRSSATGPRVL